MTQASADVFTAAAGHRSGLPTAAVFLPVQLATVWAMARHKGVV
ncbi:hypothetical protein [Streptomyces sp. S.PB5]|nr:hypothetical protein [Streptomyces sp. S.PB5]MDN3026160.1 hypothetical protein [Streptomyces sp. S.PB5]